MRSQVATRIVLSLAAIYLWLIVKDDILSPFLETGDAKKDVYVRHPCKSCDRHHYWLQLAVAYGLVNAISKFQWQTGNLILRFGLSHMEGILQRLYYASTGFVALLYSKCLMKCWLQGNLRLPRPSYAASSLLLSLELSFEVLAQWTSMVHISFTLRTTFSQFNVMKSSKL